MTLSAAQLQKIWLLSDTVLYPEAVSFLHKLMREQECDPLPASQVAGLLSIADSQKYDELYRYVVHQRERDWPPARRDLKTFYTALEQVFSLMQRALVRTLGNTNLPCPVIACSSLSSATACVASGTI